LALGSAVPVVPVGLGAQMAGGDMSAAAAVSELHGLCFRSLCSHEGRDHQGLTVAARAALRRLAIDKKTAKFLERLDIAFHVNRHINTAKATSFFSKLQVHLGAHVGGADRKMDSACDEHISTSEVEITFKTEASAYDQLDSTSDKEYSADEGKATTYGMNDVDAIDSLSTQYCASFSSGTCADNLGHDDGLEQFYIGEGVGQETQTDVITACGILVLSECELVEHATLAALRKLRDDIDRISHGIDCSCHDIGYGCQNDCSNQPSIGIIGDDIDDASVRDIDHISHECQEDIIILHCKMASFKFAVGEFHLLSEFGLDFAAACTIEMPSYDTDIDEWQCSLSNAFELLDKKSLLHHFGQFASRPGLIFRAEAEDAVRDLCYAAGSDLLDDGGVNKVFGQLSELGLVQFTDMFHSADYA